MPTPDGTDANTDPRAPRIRRAEQLRNAIDEVAAVDRELAVIAARRAALIDHVRLLSEADGVARAEEAVIAGRSVPSSGWTFEHIAHREIVSELACALRVPERAADTLIVESRLLTHHLPATETALAAGEVSYRHVQKLIDHATSLPDQAHTVFEEAVLPRAREVTVAKFDRYARTVRERMHPDSITTRTQVARDHRDITLDPARDGMAYLSAYLPAAVAVAGYNRIDDIATGLNTPEETRTQAQLRADVFGDLMIDGITDPVTFLPDQIPLTDDDILVLAEIEATEFDIAQPDTSGIEGDLIESDRVDRRQVDPGHTMPTRSAGDDAFAGIVAALRADLALQHTQQAPTRTQSQPRARAASDGFGRGIVARVMVTVPVLNLLSKDPTEEPAILEGYGPIDPDTAKHLAAGAPSFTRILTHPETGTALSIGRDSYTIPADLRRWVQLRDGTCRHPGCNQRIARCDIDHTTDWYCNGESNHDNLAHLCRAHHNLKHHTDWSYHHADNTGTLIFTAPTGHNYTTRPTSTLSPGTTPPRGTTTGRVPTFK